MTQGQMDELTYRFNLDIQMQYEYTQWANEKRKNTMKVIVKIAPEEENMLVSPTFYFITHDREFIEELKKFVCPMRLIMFLENNSRASITPLFEPFPEEEAGLVIDLRDKSVEIVESKMAKGEFFSILPEPYIEATPNLDYYGNEK